MATTTVRGAVTRTFYQGRGAEVTEEFTVKGKEITKRWACWFDEPHGLEEGQQVEVSGLHGDEVDEWTNQDQQTRHSVKRSLNRARIVGEVTSAAPAQVNQPDPWIAAGQGMNDDTPF